VQPESRHGKPPVDVQTVELSERLTTDVAVGLLPVSRPAVAGVAMAEQLPVESEVLARVTVAPEPAVPLPPPPELPLSPEIASIRAISAQDKMFVFKGKLAGNACWVLLDSGATRSFVGDAWLRATGMACATMKERLAVDTATSGRVVISTEARTRLKLAGVRTRVKLKVLPDMLPGVSVILGLDWLRAHAAELDFKREECRFELNGKPYTLRAPRAGQREPVVAEQRDESEPSEPEGEVLGVAALRAFRANPQVISAVQARRALRKGCRGYLYVVQPGQLTEDPMDVDALGAGAVLGTLSTQGEASVTSDTGVTGGVVDEQALRALLDEFNDRFQPLSKLPPDRGVPHTIRTKPGAIPPFQRPRRMSPAERAEAEKTAQSLLEMGLIEPSSSPKSASCLQVCPASHLAVCFTPGHRSHLKTVSLSGQVPILDRGPEPPVTFLPLRHQA
jgi:hypothetical protein